MDFNFETVAIIGILVLLAISYSKSKGGGSKRGGGTPSA